MEFSEEDKREMQAELEAMLVEIRWAVNMNNAHSR